jgi:hypothetical protein
MKKIILFFITFCCLKHSAQSPAPSKINYQGVARNSQGLPIVNQNISIVFELIPGTPSATSVYTETQPSIQTNSLGLFATQIGKNSSLIGFNWQNGPYFLKVSIDPAGGTNYTPLGTQQLVSVPYALYAEKAGNGALPTATLNGTTFRYNSNNSTWIIDTNLVNNGDKIRIGDKLNVKQNKLQSITNSASDSAAIFGYHYSAGPNYAGIRGFAAGNSASTGTTVGLGIFGGHFVSYNSSGSGIGAFGQASSAQSNAIGLLGIASSSGTAFNNNYAIGLYASVDASTTATNKFAGVFNRGGVLISDSLILGPLTNPGNIGDVLTKTSLNGRASWVTPSAGGGPFTQSANYIHAANSFTNSKIVFGIPYPVGGFPYQSRVSVVNASININDTSLIVLQKNTTKPALYSESNGTGYALSANNTNSLLSAYAGLFNGGLITKGKNTFTTAFTFIAQDAIGTNLFSVRNDGNVGINTSLPNAKLHIKQNAGAFSALIAEQTSNLPTATFSNTGSGSGVYAMTSASGGTNPAIFGESVGTNTNNAGVYGLSSVSSGVKGFSQNSNGVWGESNTGVGVFGLSTQNGQAGKFLLQGTTSSFQAVYVATNSNPSALKSESFGNGAAIEAVHSSTSATSPHNSLRLIDGHIAAIQGSGAFSVGSAFGSGFTIGSTGSTDVAGTLQYVSGVSSVIPGGGGNLTVTFNKSYPNKPVVVVSPVSSEWSKFSYYVVSATNSFTVFFTNNTTGSIPLNNFTDAFSYFVIGVN